MPNFKVDRSDCIILYKLPDWFGFIDAWYSGERHVESVDNDVKLRFRLQPGVYIMPISTA